jgi:hypothetical protein
VLQPSTNPTKFHRKILPLNWCVHIRHGHRALAEGKELSTSMKTCKTKNPSNHILLGNIHTYGMKLWHLWTGATSHNEIPNTLVTIPGLDERTIYNTNWPCQPPVLESP